MDCVVPGYVLPGVLGYADKLVTAHMGMLFEVYIYEHVYHRVKVAAVYEFVNNIAPVNQPSNQCP